MLKQVSSEYLQNLHTKAENDNKQIVVSALIVRNGQIFVQRRSADRKLFPNGWDIVGGHLEEGETIKEALAREIYEETGWSLEEIITHILSFDWLGDGQEKREFAFLVKVKGDLNNPKLEKDKHSAYLWIKESEIEILADNKNDMYIYNLVKKAFELI